MADEIRNCADLDERLTPYVDGEDTDVSRRAVAHHLGACPPCRHAAQEETAARDALRQHRAALAERASDTLRARCRQSASSSGFARSQFSRSPVSKWLPLSLAATLVLAVGGVFVFGLNDRVEALAASLAVNHMKCFKVEGTDHASQPATVERVWQQDQGWPITVAATDASADLKLCEVRRCFTSDGRSAHLMYTWHGAPLSVYILQKETDRDRVVRKLGTEAVIWCANHRTYAVVAGDSTQDLTPMVNYMKARVR